MMSSPCCQVSHISLPLTAPVTVRSLGCQNDITCHLSRAQCPCRYDDEKLLRPQCHFVSFVFGPSMDKRDITLKTPSTYEGPASWGWIPLFILSFCVSLTWKFFSNCVNVADINRNPRARICVCVCGCGCGCGCVPAHLRVYK